ncbi:c-type cytochrome biogenesis protein CcsB [Microbacterium sp. LRZ72]|uniref:c-type cytochrome biogenesis protein CcsB n=1 Tax=Microbacterium sp. LRZ72 TaxID=2942481 RepID=UPI0029BC41A7|nr:c-type cytochrome biogenesis protein CcsB [Microbacterium sp. LRZ72]MDX2376021.1 c-type cytochrome biogenesis protein CcsB [Microbacterium sp. LRZ72]
MPASEPLSLDAVSILTIWTAIAIYALAFVAYAFDLAQRSALATEAKDAEAQRAAELVAAGGAGSRSGNVRGAGAQTDEVQGAEAARRPKYVWARIGTALTVLGFAFHLAATVTRGIAAERVPWANMYEFAMTGTLLIIAVYLGVLLRHDLRFLGTFITGLIVVLLAGVMLGGLYVEVVPLMDPLKSVWLVIHVFVASLATAFFALAFALSVLQLMQARREARTIAAASVDDAPAVPRRQRARFLWTLPSAEALESLAYRFAIVGFIFWTFTLIAGSIWAQDAWGRYWGFDTKEVWTFVIWVLYAGYIHARATRGWRGTRSAWLSIIGFAAVIFNFTVVNVFFQGLHAYSGLS